MGDAGQDEGQGELAEFLLAEGAGDAEIGGFPKERIQLCGLCLGCGPARSKSFPQGLPPPVLTCSSILLRLVRLPKVRQNFELLGQWAVASGSDLAPGCPRFPPALHMSGSDLNLTRASDGIHHHRPAYSDCYRSGSGAQSAFGLSRWQTPFPGCLRPVLRLENRLSSSASGECA